MRSYSRHFVGDYTSDSETPLLHNRCVCNRETNSLKIRVCVCV